MEPCAHYSRTRFERNDGAVGGCKLFSVKHFFELVYRRHTRNSGVFGDNSFACVKAVANHQTAALFPNVLISIRGVSHGQSLFSVRHNNYAVRRCIVVFPRCSSFHIFERNCCSQPTRTYFKRIGSSVVSIISRKLFVVEHRFARKFLRRAVRNRKSRNARGSVFRKHHARATRLVNSHSAFGHSNGNNSVFYVECVERIRRSCLRISNRNGSVVFLFGSFKES